MTCMRARTSSNFGLIGQPTSELAAHERLKKSKLEKRCLHFFLAGLDRILFILVGNDYIRESFDEFEIQPDSTTGFHGNYRVMIEKTVSPLFLSCFTSFCFF